jgi:hypothetical protein
MRDLQADADASQDAIGPLDFRGHLIMIGTYLDTRYEGRPLAKTRWYEVMQRDETSLGLIDGGGGEYYSFRPYEAGQALGRVCRTFDDAVAYLVVRDAG